MSPKPINQHDFISIILPYYKQGYLVLPSWGEQNPIENLTISHHNVSRHNFKKDNYSPLKGPHVTYS